MGNKKEGGLDDWGRDVGTLMVDMVLELCLWETIINDAVNQNK